MLSVRCIDILQEMVGCYLRPETRSMSNNRAQCTQAFLQALARRREHFYKQQKMNLGHVKGHADKLLQLPLIFILYCYRTSLVYMSLRFENEMR